MERESSFSEKETMKENLGREKEVALELNMMKMTGRYTEENGKMEEERERLMM